ncbi:MAG TPA: GNAT family N-acetyltransferase [Candidatus Polarisedimenticolia bacterium]|nr:GNAT family N-acetyltransferase [Candidatus Polarisedimenticolia bacterium]
MRPAAQDRQAEVRIRTATHADATALADLSTQLGYPSTATEIERRLERLLPDAGQSLYVAETAEGAVVGWVHVASHCFLGDEGFADVAGLVVDERHRGRGIGRLLLAEAERWAVRHGHARMNVRSRVQRERAHRFYLDLDYLHVKDQRVFRKAIGPGGGDLR